MSRLFRQPALFLSITEIPSPCHEYDEDGKCSQQWPPVAPHVRVLSNGPLPDSGRNKKRPFSAAVLKFDIHCLL